MIYVSNITHSFSRNEHQSGREGTDLKVHQIIGILPDVSVHRKGRTVKQPRVWFDEGQCWASSGSLTM